MVEEQMDFSHQEISSGYKEEVGKVKKMCSLCTIHPSLQPQASPDAAILPVTVSH